MYYATEIRQLPNGGDCWNSIEVGIFRDDFGEPVKIGSYKRNYHRLYDTFYPFKLRGNWYALYSKDYTSTRIMELPSCKDLGGETPHAHGFCPVEYYVPYSDRELTEIDPDAAGTFGFVAGCHWGDDGSWKIQYLDLSECHAGIIKRDDRFGYIEMMPNLKLKESVDFSNYYYDPKDVEPDEDDKIVVIASRSSFKLTKRA